MSCGNEHVVKENPYSVTLRRASEKGSAKLVKAESLLEYDFYCLLDFDWRVEKYKEQPVVIPWRTKDGKIRKYTPDVLIKFVKTDHLEEFQHLRATIFEVKPYQVLKENWHVLRPKIEGIKASLEGTGVSYKVYTERQIRGDFLNNVKFLLGYSTTHLVSENRLSADQKERLVAVQQCIPTQDITTPREILEKISHKRLEQAYFVPWIWNMLRTGLLQADLIEPLSLDTIVWANSFKRDLGKWMTKKYDWYR